MTVGYIQPNSDDVPNDWNPIASTEYILIDEPYGSPNTSDYISAINIGGDDNKVSEFGFPNTINDVGEVTQIIVHSYGIRVGSNTPEVDLSMGGYIGYVECSIGTGWGWATDIWNGSWTQANLDAVQVRYRADVPSKNDSNQISCVYLEVTYTPPVVEGWAHKWVGFTPDKWNGMDIGKILGIG